MTNIQSIYSILASQQNADTSEHNFLNRSSTVKLLHHVVSDIAFFHASIAIAFYLSLYMKRAIAPFYSHPSTTDLLQLYPTLFLPPLVGLLVWSYKKGHYTRFKAFWDELRELTVICLTTIGIVIGGLYLLRFEFSRSILIASWLLLLLLIPVGRNLTKKLLTIRGLWFTPTLVIGTGENAIAGALAIESDPNLGFRVLSIVDLNCLAQQLGPEYTSINTSRHESGHDHKPRCDSHSPEDQNVEVFDPLNQTTKSYTVIRSIAILKRTLRTHPTPYIVFAPEPGDFVTHHGLFDQLMVNRHSFSVIPALKGVPSACTEISPIFKQETLHLKITTNRLTNSLPKKFKRYFDFTASALLLIILSPLLAILAVLIMSDGGNPLFGQIRVGQNGKLFKCWKFRSMQPDSQKILSDLLASDNNLNKEYKNNQKIKKDPRITKLGSILRRFSFDELPQLYNIFIGEMSFVGPRPVREDELEEKYAQRSSYYLATPPGITGLWQISGRNDLDYQTRIYLDTWYVRNWTLWYDLQILAKTFRVVLTAKGAY